MLTPSNPGDKPNASQDASSHPDVPLPPDAVALIRFVVEQLSDLKRIGLPSDELDRLKERHPEAYEIHLAEMREQPIHDRKLELEQLALAKQQLEQTNALQKTQFDVAEKALDIQGRWADIAESNATTGRKLSWIVVILSFLLLVSVVSVNTVFVARGIVENFTFATSVIIGFLGTGGLFAIIRALISRRHERSDSRPNTDA